MIRSRRKVKVKAPGKEPGISVWTGSFNEWFDNFNLKNYFDAEVFYSFNSKLMENLKYFQKWFKICRAGNEFTILHSQMGKHF